MMIVHDWMDYVSFVVLVVSAFATVVAAGLAWWAVRTANRTALDSNKALAHERRAAFELTVLARVAEVYGLRISGSADALRGLLLTLPNDDDLPVLRAFLRNYPEISMPNNDDAERRKQFQEELREAVNRRMDASWNED